MGKSSNSKTDEGKIEERKGEEERDTRIKIMEKNK